MDFPQSIGPWKNLTVPPANRPRPDPAAGTADSAEGPSGVGLVHAGHCSGETGRRRAVRRHGQEPRSTKHVSKQFGPIGHDPVDAEVEQPPHLDGIVDRPHVHLEAGGVRRRQKPGRDDRHPLIDDRHLRRDGRGGELPAGQACPQQPEGLPRRERRRDVRAESGAKCRRAADRRTTPRTPGPRRPSVRMTSTSGPTAPAALASMLKRASGSSSSRSVSNGIGSVPPIRARRTRLHGMRADRPRCCRSPDPAVGRERRSAGRRRWRGHRSPDSDSPRRTPAGRQPGCSPARRDHRRASPDGRTRAAGCHRGRPSPGQSGTTRTVECARE